MKDLCEDCPHPLRCDAAGGCLWDEKDFRSGRYPDSGNLMKWVAIFCIGGVALLAWMFLL